MRALLSILLGIALSVVAIAQAKEPKHWAYVPPSRSAFGPIGNPNWLRSPIDGYILSRIEREKLQPSPPADKATLLRRVTFGLTGVPPTLDEIDAFVADETPDAYERVVDRLLASPRYGERMAIHWLDLARYADTHGYHADTHRDMWRWRDWVIDAFNHDMPFDQFTVEQLAGDLLPNATLDQKIATGFHRNHMINFENGTIPEEYRTEYVVDRAVTTSTVWLGLTLQCARCHDHKHDPFTTHDFYRLYAYFNNVPEAGLDGQKGNAAPYIPAPTRIQQQRIAELQREMNELEKAMNAQLVAADAAQEKWEERQRGQGNRLTAPPSDTFLHIPMDDEQGEHAAEIRNAFPPGAITGDVLWVKGKSGGALLFTGDTGVQFGDICSLEQSQPFSFGVWLFPTSSDESTVMAKWDETAGQRGFELGILEKKLRVRLAHDEHSAMEVCGMATLESSQWHHVLMTYSGIGRAAGIRVYVDGKAAELRIKQDNLVGSIQNAQPFTIGQRNGTNGFRGMLDELRVYRRALSADEAEALADRDPIREMLATPRARRSPRQAIAVRRFYLESTSRSYQQQATQLVELRRQLAEVEQAVPTTMVMQELATPRETRVLKNGQYDQTSVRVYPHPPALFNRPIVKVEDPPNRYGLAAWLVGRRTTNSLTARVTANRFWQLHFGIGLVATSDDFGHHGEMPSHPELLDYLALDLRWADRYEDDDAIRASRHRANALHPLERNETSWVSTDEPGVIRQSYVGAWNSNESLPSWYVKRFQRRIVTSATYRQSSQLPLELLQRDPHNRLLARGPRLRLPAEMVRDSALFASGQMDLRVGGPSVFPHQPAGLWEEVAYDTKSFTAQTYTPSRGGDLFRRSLYTFWKRAVPPPSLVALDAPDREICTVTRPRSNTPLQALVLMNDPAYIEAARRITAISIRESNGDLQAGLARVFRKATSRNPSGPEQQLLQELFAEQLAEFQNTPDLAEKVVASEPTPFSSLPRADFAAAITVSSMILSLDEALHAN